VGRGSGGQPTALRSFLPTAHWLLDGKVPQSITSHEARIDSREIVREKWAMAGLWRPVTRTLRSGRVATISIEAGGVRLGGPS